MVDSVAFSSNSKCLAFVCVEEKLCISRGGLDVLQIILDIRCIILRAYYLVNLCVVSKRRDLRSIGLVFYTALVLWYLVF